MFSPAGSLINLRALIDPPVENNINSKSLLLEATPVINMPQNLQLEPYKEENSMESLRC